MRIPTNGIAEVNGTRLYYEVAGAGQPLVLVHGFGVDSRIWDDQFESFAQRHRVVRYDARGFGRSALPTRASYAHHDDLRALLEHLGIASASILGLSMGGGIAVNFALTHPDMAASLVLVDSNLSGFQWKEFGKQLERVRSKGREEGSQAAKELFLGLGLLEPAMTKTNVKYRLMQMVNDYSGWHFQNTDPLRVPDTLAMELLEEITAPTLVIVGERDLPDFHEVAEVLSTRIPNARKIVLPGAGHVPNMEEPTRFNAAVLDFLRGF